MTTEKLRDKDIAVLQAIHQGAETTSEIRETTTLTNREINYSINEYSLEQLNLVEVDRPEGREWQETNGEERYIWKPKQLQLTDQGLQTLAQLENGQSDRYEDMSKRELIEQIHELEERMNRLEADYKSFKHKVIRKV